MIVSCIIVLAQGFPQHIISGFRNYPLHQPNVCEKAVLYITTMLVNNLTISIISSVGEWA